MKKLIAAFVFGSCAFAATSLFADYGYYDDGHLLAQWDAIDNQATGEHVDGAATWVDLKTGGEFVLNGATWGDRFLQFAGANTSYAQLTDETVLGLLTFPDATATRTVEVAYRYTTTANSGGQGLLFQGQSGTGIGIGRWYTATSTYHILGHGSGTLTMPTPRDTDFHTVAVGYLNKKPSTAAGTCFEDGESRTLSGSNYWGDNDAAMYLGRGKTQYPAAAKIYSVRIYDCLLTPEQAEQNRAVDLTRFLSIPILTVKSGTVTIGDRTYAAGEEVRVAPETTAIVIGSADAATVELAPQMADLTVSSGSLALVTDGSRAALNALALGEGVTLQMPTAGLEVLGTVAAGAGATVKGPGTLYGNAAESPVTLSGGATYVSLTQHAFGDDTIAFYPFTEGKAGTSAAGVTLRNVLNPTLCPGSVQVADGQSVTFSDEAPGAYVFTNLSYTGKAVYEHPRSLYVKDGAVFFDELVKEALKLGQFKIEFWYRFDDTMASTWSDFVTICGGWNKNGSTLTDFWLGLQPTALGSETDYATHYQKLHGLNADGTRGDGNDGYYHYPNGSHKDGKWHHIAFLFPYNNKYMCFANDFFTQDGGTRENLVDSFTDGAEDLARPFIIGNGRHFRGWVSCVRLSKHKNIGKNGDFMPLRPSNCISNAPALVTHVRFEEGVAGAALPEIVESSGANYMAATKDLYRNSASPNSLTANFLGDFTLTPPEDETMPSDPAYAADVKKNGVLESADAEAIVSNRLSAAFVSPSTDPADDKMVAGTGLLLKKGDFCPLRANDPFTVELSFKFDYADWKARVGDVTAKGKHVALCWGTYTSSITTDSGGYSAGWSLNLDLSNENAPKIYARGYTSTQVAPITSERLLDGKWHQVALTVNPAKFAISDWTAEYSILLDFKERATGNGVYFKIHTTNGTDYPANRNIWIARGDRGVTAASAHAFNGKIDEFRLSYGVLAEDQLLRQKNFPQGLLMIVR